MPKMILAADDSPTIREIVRYTLGAEGYSVLLAQDGLEALKVLSTSPVNMLITDLNMPGLDGIGLIKKVREIPSYKFIPIIMVTTESSDEKKQAGKAAGATAWIVKPFKPDDLVSVVKKVLH